MNDLPPNGADEPRLDLGAPAPKAEGYLVLARKYRPQSFADLIGQEAMVRTLKNAFASGRIAHAFMLTGVRGVGKTTTARIIARALNYHRADGSGGPTIDMTEPGVHDVAIAESRHPDVLEMDAASRTGINDIREIIDGVRYAPVAARYKVYIIDEVHMLSTQAFNGLLKTLEEPPPHVKFIFATTEVRKVPVTVLSRCQRFDLKRIETDQLIALLKDITEKEGASAQDGALRLIARAGEGSARDALSILEQAIARGGRPISEEAVRDMLGLADRTQTIELLERIFRGEIAPALTLLDEQFKMGADPLAVVQDLATLVHQATKAKVLGAEADPAATQAESARIGALAAAAGIAHLGRAWQLLLKAIAEVREASDAAAAAEMAVIRLAYLSELPTPEELVKRLDAGASNSAPKAQNEAAQRRPSVASARAQSAVAAEARAISAAPPDTSTQAHVRLASFADVVREAEARKELRLARELTDDVRLVRFERGLIEFVPGERAAPDLGPRLRRTLEGWTGETWMISLAAGGTAPAQGAPTVREQRLADEARIKADAAADPLVKAIIETFPGAQIVDVKDAPAPETFVPEAEDPEEPFEREVT